MTGAQNQRNSGWNMEMAEGLHVPSECIIDRPSIPDYPKLEGPTIPIFAPRRFTCPSPNLLRKFIMDAGEADMMSVVTHYTRIPVPTVHKLERFPASSPSHPPLLGMTMDLIPGRPLSAVWLSLSPEKQAVLKQQLRSLLLDLRRHTFSHTGRPGKTPCVFNDTAQWAVKCEACDSEEAWNESRIAAARDSGRADDATVGTLRALLARSGHGHRFVLTHADLSDRNILVDDTGSRIVALLDWEYANVMPDYFEYVAARLSPGHASYWRDVLIEVFEGLPGLESSEEMEDLVDAERIMHGYGKDSWWTFLGSRTPDYAM